MDEQELFQRLVQSLQEQVQTGKSIYAEEFKDEHRVIPSIAGLPRIIRQFV